MKKAVPGAIIHYARYKQLDSLRGLAAITVFFTHFLGLKGSLPLFYQLKQTPLGILVNGNAAVMFFFVLSGFVLSLPFVGGEKPLKLTAFYIKRIFRIYPAFIFAILFSMLLKQFLFDKTAMASFLGWIENFWNWDWDKAHITELSKTFLLVGPNFDLNLFDPPIWSLVIEMKMSFILPFFIVIVSYNKPALNIGLLLVITWFTYQYNEWGIVVFYLGILMAKYKDVIVNILKQKGIVFLIIAGLFAALLYNNNYEFPQFLQHIQSPQKYVWSKYLMAAGSCIIIMIVLASIRISHFLERRVFTFFGDISYSFYLIHAPLLLTMASLFTNKYMLSPIYIFLSSFMLAIAAAYLMFVFIEKPFQQLAKRLIVRFKILNSLSINSWNLDAKNK